MVAAHEYEGVREASGAERNSATALVLQDYTQKQRTRRCSLRRSWERILFASAAVIILLFFAYSLSASIWRAASRIYAPSARTSPAQAVTMKVLPGETLWHLAAKYGAPDSYQLDRVETLARENHLSPDTPLIPGQSLHITVRNPVEIAKLQRHHRVNLAALPR